MKFTGSSSVGPVYGKISDPRTGDQIVAKYQGTPTDMAALYAATKASGQRVQYDPDPEGSHDTVIITLGAESTQPPDQPLSDLWGRAINDLEKSLWECPILQAAIWGTSTHAGMGLTNEELTQLRQDIEDFLAGQKVFSEIRNYPTSGDAKTAFDLYLEWRLSGVESFIMSQVIVRRTRVIASNSTIEADDTNLNRIYTTTELEAAFPTLASAKFRRPDGYWLYKGSQVDQTAADKWTITEEWWHSDDYCDLAYERAE